ncbi:MAG: hypothetical protein V2A73_20075 [Pseudomonadota bacterium]
MRQPRIHARTLANASTVTFVAGAACLVVGTVLWWTAPGKKEVEKKSNADLFSARLLPGPLGIAVVGSF